MTGNGNQRDIGFVITKAPHESGLVANALTTALHAMEQGKTIGLFLISDGVWLSKKHQRNGLVDTLGTLMAGGATVRASGDHLRAAGIPGDEVMDGITITDHPYRDLVVDVMEHWGKVMTI